MVWGTLSPHLTNADERLRSDLGAVRGKSRVATNRELQIKRVGGGRFEQLT